MELPSVLGKAWGIFIIFAKLVAEYPVAGLGMIGVSMIVLFYLSSMAELQFKKWLMYGTLVLLVFFILVVFAAMGIHVQIPLNEWLLNASRQFRP